MVSCHLSPVTCHFILNWFWKGGESLPSRFAGRGRKVRTPKGAMPRNLVAAVYDRRQTKIHAGGKSREFPTDSATENRQPRHFGVGVMVKRCGKSAPREAQATRHGKPHRVQGQIGNPGAARSRFRESETDSGYRLLRQMILSARKSADRIRLTALPKPTSRHPFHSPGKIGMFQIPSDHARPLKMNSRWTLSAPARPGVFSGHARPVVGRHSDRIGARPRRGWY